MAKFFYTGERGGGGGLATDAALADDGFRVGDFLFGDAFDGAAGFADFEGGFGPGDGVADFDGGGEGVGVGLGAEFPALLDELVEGRGAFGLDDAEAREAGNEAVGAEFAEGLAEGGHVAEVAAGKDDPIGDLPIELIEQFDDDGFLAFDAEGVDGVEEVDAEAIGEGADEGEDLIEVGFDLEGACAVFEGLGEFAEADVAVGEEDDGFETGGGGVGGHGGGGVAGGDAGDAAEAEAPGLGGAAGHAVVLEGAGGVEALVLEAERVEAGVGGGVGGVEEGGVAFAEGDGVLGLAVEGEHFAVAPDAARIEGCVRHAAFATEFFEGGGVGRGSGESDFEQASTLRAGVEDAGDGKAGAAGGLKARQFSLHGESLSMAQGRWRDGLTGVVNL